MLFLIYFIAPLAHSLIKQNFTLGSQKLLSFNFTPDGPTQVIVEFQTDSES